MISYVCKKSPVVIVRLLLTRGCFDNEGPPCTMLCPPPTESTAARGVFEKSSEDDDKREPNDSAILSACDNSYVINEELLNRLCVPRSSYISVLSVVKPT